MLKLLIAASCLIAACTAQGGGTLQALCTAGVMKGGVTDRLSDTMGIAARQMIQPGMANNPLALQTLSGSSPQWKCLVDSAAVVNPMTRQIDVGATAGTISDYFDTVVELKRFIPFFNPCDTVFCGEKGISPLTIASEVVRSLSMRMPMANNHAKFFGTQASLLPFGTTSQPKNPGLGMMGAGMPGAGTAGIGGGAANPMLNMMNLLNTQQRPQLANTGGNTNVAPPSNTNTGTNTNSSPSTGSNKPPTTATNTNPRPSNPGSMVNPMSFMNQLQAMQNIFQNPTPNAVATTTSPATQPQNPATGNTGMGMGTMGMGNMGMGMPGMGMNMPGMGMNMPGMGMNMPGMGMNMPGMGMNMPGMGGMGSLFSAMMMGEAMADAPDMPAGRGAGMGMGGMGGMGAMGGMGGMGGLAGLMSGLGGGMPGMGMQGMGMPGMGMQGMGMPGMGMQGMGMPGMGMPGMGMQGMGMPGMGMQGMSSNPMAQLASAMGMGATTGTPTAQTAQPSGNPSTGGAGGMNNFANLFRMMG